MRLIRTIWWLIAATTLASTLGLLPSPVIAADPVGCPNPTEVAMAALINQERAQHGLAPLGLEIQLGEASQLHSEDMATNEFFSHEGSDGSRMGDRMSAAGYSWTYAGETIAAGYTTALDAVEGWMNSAPHRDILLGTQYDHLGVGYVARAGSPWGHYWTANFGSTFGTPALADDFCGDFCTNFPDDPICLPPEPFPAEQLVTARTLLVKDSAGAPDRRRLKLSSRDTSMRFPDTGSDGDPRVFGATLRVTNPSSGETMAIHLPPGPEWRGFGSPAGASGYQYRDSKRQNGPCKTLTIRPGRLAATCVGAGLDFTLDEAMQGALAVTVKLGSETSYCMGFGPETVRRDSVNAAGVGRFKATDAPAPETCF